MSQFERIVRKRYLLDAAGLWIRFAEISGQNTFPFWFALRSGHRTKYLLKKIVDWDAGHIMLWSISVNLVVLQGLMSTPQDCKVMRVAACEFVSIWSYIRGWQCHRMLWNGTNGYLLQNLVIFIWNYPYWFAISSQRLSYCNVNQNSCRPTTASLTLSWVDLLAHFP